MNRQDDEASDDQEEEVIQDQNGNQYVRHANGPQLVNQNEDDSEDSGAEEEEDITVGQQIREEGLLGDDEIEEIDT
jgi:hypothetical protein|tara:strand:- start:1476 stop:1703 length:228 start_codon:yes stop_codon:yes gene_type:complete